PRPFPTGGSPSSSAVSRGARASHPRRTPLPVFRWRGRPPRRSSAFARCSVSRSLPTAALSRSIRCFRKASIASKPSDYGPAPAGGRGVGAVSRGVAGTARGRGAYVGRTVPDEGRGGTGAGADAAPTMERGRTAGANHFVAQGDDGHTDPHPPPQGAGARDH